MLFYNQRCELTLSFKKPSAIVLTDLQTLATKLGDWWNAVIKPLQVNTVNFREVYIRDLTTAGGISWSDTARLGTAGTHSAGSQLPSNVAFVVSFRTGLRGRANRGRNYFFGLGANDLTGGIAVSSTYRNSVIAAYNALKAGGTYDPTPFTWVVASRQLDGIVGGRAIPVTAVVATDDYVDSQRRRLPGRGL